MGSLIICPAFAALDEKVAPAFRANRRIIRIGMPALAAGELATF